MRLLIEQNSSFAACFLSFNTGSQGSKKKKNPHLLRLLNVKNIACIIIFAIKNRHFLVSGKGRGAYFIFSHSLKLINI